MDNLKSVATNTQIKYATQEEYEVFGNQSDNTATLDLQTGTVKLSIVTDGAPDGVKVTLNEDTHNTIISAVYGFDPEKIFDLDIYGCISKVECLNTGKSVFLSQAIFRAVKLAIAKVQLEVMDQGLSHAREEVRESLQKRIDNNMFQ